MMIDKEKTSSKKVIQGMILFVLYLFVLFFLVKYISNNPQMMEKIKNAPPRLVGLGILTTVLGITLTALLDITCTKVYGMKLDVKDAVFFTFIASAINLVVPLQAGSILKAVYYKRRMKLTYSRFISITSGTIVINVIMTFFVLIISLFILMLGWHIDKKYIVFALIVFFVGISALLLVICKQDKILGILPFKKYTYPIMSGFFEIFNNRRAIVLCSANYIFTMLLGGIRFATIFMLLEISSDVANGLLYYGLYNVSSLVHLLPGNVGISEGFVGLMNMLLGADFDTGVTAVFINRIYYYIAAFAGTLLFSVPAWLLYSKEESHDECIDNK